MYRQRARMVAKIFRGAKPADIPVEQSARFQLIINLKAAKSIGHEVPAGDHSQQHGSYLLQHCGYAVFCSRSAVSRAARSVWRRPVALTARVSHHPMSITV
jgi:ABC transporter substrate binding protein